MSQSSCHTRQSSLHRGPSSCPKEQWSCPKRPASSHMWQPSFCKMFDGVFAMCNSQVVKFSFTEVEFACKEIMLLCTICWPTWHMQQEVGVCGYYGTPNGAEFNDRRIFLEICYLSSRSNFFTYSYIGSEIWKIFYTILTIVMKLCN